MKEQQMKRGVFVIQFVVGYRIDEQTKRGVSDNSIITWYDEWL